MVVTKEQVLSTAALARIELDDAIVDKLASQMESIVGYIDILNQVDTTGVEPLYSPVLEIAPPREDVAEPGMGVDELLKGAPRKQGRFYSVPPVIG